MRRIVTLISLIALVSRFDNDVMMQAKNKLIRIGRYEPP